MPKSQPTQKTEFKKDEYRLVRGGYSKLLKLSCRVCQTEILLYQKDGPGSLRRLYFDRIVMPKQYKNLETTPIKAIPTLRCSNCKEDLGTPYVYPKENRKAFKLYQDALTKEVVKLKDIIKK